MEPTQPSFIKRRLNSFGYAVQGLSSAFRSEINLRWHVLSAGLVIAMGLYVGLTGTEWALISLAIGLVWMAELFNTAIEVVVNLVSPGRHPLAGKAKDIAAGAVLIASLTAAAIGTFIFFPHVADLLKSLSKHSF